MTDTRDRDLPKLGVGLADHIASLIRGVLGAGVLGTSGGPDLGPAIADAVTMLLPYQRADRLEDFVRKLKTRIDRVEATAQRIGAERVRASPEALGLIEAAIGQAARAVSENRRRYLAAIVVNGLTAESYNAAEPEKLLRLLEGLTDEEVVFLAYWGTNPTLGPRGRGADFYRLHEQVLRPASREIGASMDERKRQALQDSYYETLARLGLVLPGHQGPGAKHLTPLGLLLLSYLEVVDVEEPER